MLSEEEAWNIVNYQMSTFHHLRSSAQGSLRTIIAIVGVAATILLTGITNGVELSSTPVLENWNIVVERFGGLNGALISFLITGIYISGFSFVIMSLSLFKSVTELVSVVSSETLEPGLKTENRIQSTIVSAEAKENLHHVLDRSSTSLAIWIENNEYKLESKHKSISSGVSNAYISFLFTLTFVIVVVGMAQANIASLMAIYAALMVPGIVVIVVSYNLGLSAVSGLLRDYQYIPPQNWYLIGIGVIGTFLLSGITLLLWGIEVLT